MAYCKRDHCGNEADLKSGGARLCTVHLADRDERRRRGRMIPKCSHPGCNQQRNSISTLCGVHWNALLAERDRLEAEQSFKDRLRAEIRAAPDFEALKEVLADCVDCWIDL